MSDSVNLAAGDPALNLAAGDPALNLAAGDPALNLAAGDPALWTLGVTAYAAAILVCTGVAVNAAARGRRRTALVMAVAVVALSFAGVVVAVLSSTH